MVQQQASRPDSCKIATESAQYARAKCCRGNGDKCAARQASEMVGSNNPANAIPKRSNGVSVSPNQMTKLKSSIKLFRASTIECQSRAEATAPGRVATHAKVTPLAAQASAQAAQAEVGQDRTFGSARSATSNTSVNLSNSSGGNASTSNMRDLDDPHRVRVSCNTLFARSPKGTTYFEGATVVIGGACISATTSGEGGWPPQSSNPSVGGSSVAMGFSAVLAPPSSPAPSSPSSSSLPSPPSSPPSSSAWGSVSSARDGHRPAVSAE
mmetsp:Transcript_109285/g.308356  ORF Transcript_109285/g.308356 Transcript_109285/m.308356 type:complete len:268 (+) Transcript_109285:925-1728(+)